MRRLAAAGALLWGTAAGAPEDAAPPPQTLADCLARAEAASERLAAAVEEVHAARAREDTARAAVLPRFAVRSDYTRQEPASGFGSASGLSLSERTESWLEARQPLFSGWRDIHGRRARAEQTAAARSDRDQALLDLRLAVCEAYAEVLSFEAQAEAVASALSLARDRRRELAARLEAGLARRSEFLFADAQVARQEAQAQELAGRARDARALLAFLTGAAADGPLAPFPPTAPPSTDAEVLLDRALARRADLAALEREEAAARAAIRAEESGWFPTLDLVGNLYGRREGVNEDVDWDATLRAEWALYEGGGTDAAVREATARHRQAVLAVREKRRLIRREIAQALSAYETASASVESLRREVAAADETARLLTGEFRQGIATHIESLAAQDTLLAARVELARRTLARAVAAVRLWVVTGMFPEVEASGKEAE